MGRGTEIIEDESLSPSTRSSTGTTVSLEWLKEKQSIDKTLETVGRLLVEKLLPYFITEGYLCPRIELSEKSGENRLILNDFFSNPISSDIKEVAYLKNKFSLQNGDKTEDFTVRIFKIFYSRTSRSKMSLVAHMREVIVPFADFLAALTRLALIGRALPTIPTETEPSVHRQAASDRLEACDQDTTI